MKKLVLAALAGSFAMAATSAQAEDDCVGNGCADTTVTFANGRYTATNNGSRRVKVLFPYNLVQIFQVLGPGQSFQPRDPTGAYIWSYVGKLRATYED